MILNSLDRGTNGQINCYGFASTPYKNLPLKYLDKEYYLNKLNDYRENNTVHIIPYRWNFGCWSEIPLVRWILYNCDTLGFEKVIHEKTDEYNKLKKKMGFPKFPDMLVLQGGEWLRLEVECWGHKYHYCHGNGYADLVYAYDNYQPSPSTAPIFTLKKFLKCTEIISAGEFIEFLYCYDEEFKQEYDKAETQYFADKMGITVPW